MHITPNHSTASSNSGMRLSAHTSLAHRGVPRHKEPVLAILSHSRRLSVRSTRARIVVCFSVAEGRVWDPAPIRAPVPAYGRNALVWLLGAALRRHQSARTAIASERTHATSTHTGEEPASEPLAGHDRSKHKHAPRWDQLCCQVRSSVRCFAVGIDADLPYAQAHPASTEHSSEHPSPASTHRSSLPLSLIHI